MPLSVDEGYWTGATWVFVGTITNNGANSGSQVYSISPGAGNELEVLYGHLLNGDTSARVASVNITDGTNSIAALLDDLAGISITGGVTAGFPTGGDVPAAAGNATGPTRYILSGAMTIDITLAGVAVSQNTRLGIACRIRGGIPTVTFTSPTGAVEVTTTNQVF